MIHSVKLLREKLPWMISVFFIGIWISVFVGGGYEKKAPDPGPVIIIKRGGYYSFYLDKLKGFAGYRSVGNLRKMENLIEGKVVRVHDPCLRIKILDRSQAPFIKVQWGTRTWGPEIWTLSEFVEEGK